MNPKLTQIPIPTFVPYQVDEEGNVYKEGEPMYGWTHYPPKRYGSNPYKRVRLKMANGEEQFFYVQRLMGFTFFGLTITDQRIMCHGPGGSLDNSRANLSIGDDYINQTKHRMAQGTYMARGGYNTEEVRAREAMADQIANNVLGADLQPIDPNF